VCVFEDFGNVEQRLGGNTATVEADTSRVRLLIDEGDLYPQIGRQEGSRIASGATPNDGQLRSVWWHACSALQSEQKGLLQRLDYPAQKAHAIGTIDQAMIIR
jgi:hypothetical protein